MLFCPQPLKQVFTTVMLNRCDVTLGRYFIHTCKKTKSFRLYACFFALTRSEKFRFAGKEKRSLINEEHVILRSATIIGLTTKHRFVNYWKRKKMQFITSTMFEFQSVMLGLASVLLHGNNVCTVCIFIARATYIGQKWFQLAALSRSL